LQAACLERVPEIRRFSVALLAIMAPMGAPSNLINPEDTFETARAEVAIAAMTTS
jgi:hypothetical protein